MIEKRKETEKKRTPPAIIEIPRLGITDFRDRPEFIYFMRLTSLPVHFGLLFTPFEITGDLNLVCYDLKQAGFGPGTKEYEQQVKRFRKTFYSNEIK